MIATSRRLTAGWFAVALFSVPAATPVFAQQERIVPPLVLDAAGGGDDLDLRAAFDRAQSQFRLMGFADFAITGTRSRGDQVANLTNTSPFDYYFINKSGTLWLRGTPIGTSQIFFEAPLWAGVPRSEWLKHRATVPSLAGALGGGWVSNFNSFFINGVLNWHPADGTLGRLHSGATTTTDGLCTDHSDSFATTTGVSLMAGSDCPETWGGDGFLARRLIPFDGWLEHYGSFADRSEFTWDFWKVPAELHSGKTLGDYETFGEINDFYRERLADFGSVIPGQTGSPTRQGWPLGLTFRFDAFTFALPAVANAVFWQATVVNNSAQVYGVGLDYDSLYIGLMPEPLMNFQRPAFYYRPELGALLLTNNGVNPRCNDAVVISGVFGCSGIGFAAGATAIIVLKSPIGDLRNKVFSDPRSAFFTPGHPLAGDTITFNHGHMCGFGAACWSRTVATNVRRGFGMFASKPEDVLDGGTAAALSDVAYWRTFRSVDFPARSGRFNRFIPGTWRYTNRPAGTGAGPDTLYLDSCIGGVPEALGNFGCVAPWSDTMPGPTKYNNNIGNVSTGIGVGPFPLAAGDTAAFVLAFVSGQDAAAMATRIQNTLAFYIGLLYEGPEAPPPSTIVSVSTRAGDRGRAGGAQVRLFIDDAVENWVDPFLARLANQLEGSEDAVNNPWLADSLRTLSRNNIKTLYVFKSCDFGNTFTADTDCDGDPAVDDRGQAIKTGWRPYQTFLPAADGSLPNALVDAAVTPGVTYLYTILAETHGATFTLLDPGAPLGYKVVEYAPSLLNPLSRSAADPNVASVYVPASDQAGSQPARLSILSDDSLNATARYHPIEFVLAGDIETTGEFRVLLGDSVIVREARDTLSGNLSTRVRVLRVVPGLVGGSVRRVVVDSTVLVTSNPAGVNVAGGVTTTGASGDSVITTVTMRPLAVVVVRGTAEPLFASSVLDGSNTTPGSFLGRTDFPRFVLLVNSGRAALLDRQVWLDANGDTMRAAGSPALTRTASTSRANESFGEYLFLFRDSDFGPDRTFEVDVLNPDRTRQAFVSSLNRRQEADRTDTSDSIVEIIRRDLVRSAAFSADSLASVKLPFTLRNLTGRRDVKLAMLRTAKLDSVTLGADVNQVRVPVPSDVWVPGEPLILIERRREALRARLGATVYFLRDANGSLVFGDTTLVTWSSFTLGCTITRVTCNPVTFGTPGATQFNSVRSGQSFLARFFNAFTGDSRYTFRLEATVAGTQATALKPGDLDQIKVVPNPYIVFSEYEQRGADRRIAFVGLPPRGKIDIYSVSGQFVQRISYEASELAGNGDLFWNMRTREGTELASGLYLFIVDGELPASGQRVRKLGKFVVIR